MNERASHVLNAVGYIRCSVSAAAGLESVGFQMSSLDRFCARNGYRLGGYVVEFGAPAALPHAPLFRSLLPASSRPKQFDVVVACSASRIARDMAGLKELCSRFVTAGVQLVTIKDGALTEGDLSLGTLYNVQEGRQA